MQAKWQQMCTYTLVTALLRFISLLFIYIGPEIDKDLFRVGTIGYMIFSVAHYWSFIWILVVMFSAESKACMTIGLSDKRMLSNAQTRELYSNQFKNFYAIWLLILLAPLIGWLFDAVFKFIRSKLVEPVVEALIKEEEPDFKQCNFDG